MDFLAGDATGLLKRVDAVARCTYTYKMLPQDRKEAVCCACWSGGQGLGAARVSEGELTLGRRSGRVEAIEPDLPPRVPGASAAPTFNSSTSSSPAVPHLLLRNSYVASVPVVRCFQMPAACVQVGLLHEPQDRLLLNAIARDDLIYRDPFFSAFNSVTANSPSPLLPLAAYGLLVPRPAAAADHASDIVTSPEGTTTHSARANASFNGEEATAATEGVGTIDADSTLSAPRLLFCVDEVGHLVLLDWHGHFFEQLSSDRVSNLSEKNSSVGRSSVGRGGTERCTPVHVRSVPSYNVQSTNQPVVNTSSSEVGNNRGVGGRNSIPCKKKGRGSIDTINTDANGDISSSSCSVDAMPSVPLVQNKTVSTVTREPWYCRSLQTSDGDEEDSVASHVRAAWRLCGPVGCATSVNPLLPDRIAFGGRNNDVKVFDFSQEKYVWAAKNVKATLLRLQVPVHVTSLCWLPQVHPLVLAVGTAAGALRLYDLRCQRRPVFEQEYACSSSSLGGKAGREPRVLCSLCTETIEDEAAALLDLTRKPSSSVSGRCSSMKKRNNNAAWTRSDNKNPNVGRSAYCDGSSSPSSSGGIPEVMTRNNKRGRDSSNSSNDNVCAEKHNGTTGSCDGDCDEGFRTGTSEDANSAVENIKELPEIYKAVRGLYGKEKTRIFFSDNYGAVYVHRLLTGESLLRRIDPQQKKYNRTSCYAASSSSEDTEGDSEEEDSTQSGEDSSNEEDGGNEEHSESEEDSEEEEEEDSSERESDTWEKQRHILASEEGAADGDRQQAGKSRRQPGAAKEVLVHVSTKKNKKRHRISNTLNNDVADVCLSSTADSLTERRSAPGKKKAVTGREETDTPMAAFADEKDISTNVGKQYDKNHAMQLVRKHLQRRAQKLSIIKNSGKLAQSSLHGPQFMTLFEGCYKGAMGAIVALNVDRTAGLLIGGGYGRHALVWNVRSRKLLFKVYLKQQLRTILLRYGGEGRSHELIASKRPQLADLQPVEEGSCEKMSRVSPGVSHGKPESSMLVLKHKKMDPQQQPSQQLNVVRRRQEKGPSQTDHGDTHGPMREASQQEGKTIQGPMQQLRTDECQRQQRQKSTKTYRTQSVVEKLHAAKQHGRAVKKRVAKNGTAAARSGLKAAT